MTMFKNIKIHGVVYEFKHLAPIDTSFVTSAGLRRFEIVFGNHCFTESYGSNHTVDLLYKSGIETRAFSVTRYEFSLQLPDIMKSIVHKPIYISRDSKSKNNFMIVEILNRAGLKQNYVVFFDVFHSKKRNIDYRIFVKSAYIKANIRQMRNSARFDEIIPIGTKK